MASDMILKLVAEHGPWVLLVFYLLYRDLQKDQATRAVLDKNSSILIEITTIIASGCPPQGGDDDLAPVHLCETATEGHLPRRPLSTSTVTK